MPGIYRSKTMQRCVSFVNDHPREWFLLSIYRCSLVTKFGSFYPRRTCNLMVFLFHSQARLNSKVTHVAIAVLSGFHAALHTRPLCPTNIWRTFSSGIITAKINSQMDQTNKIKIFNYFAARYSISPLVKCTESLFFYE